MKKILISIFAFALIFVMALGITSCGKVEFQVDFVVDGEVYSSLSTNGAETIKMPSDPEKDGYIFDGWYWDKDTWKKPFTANSLLDAPLSDNLSVYAKWTTAESLTGTQVEISTFEKTGENEYSLTVPNATTTISLEPLVSINSRSSWVLTTDVYGNQTIASKTATLTAGDNFYYVLVTAEDGSTQLYTLKIRRKPMYSVSFDSAGGLNVNTQQIEEGGLATEPQTSREGYDFSSWNFDFTTPITESKTIMASWTPKRYTVTYDAAGAPAEEATTLNYVSRFVDFGDGYGICAYKARPGTAGVRIVAPAATYDAGKVFVTVNQPLSLDSYNALMNPAPETTEPETTVAPETEAPTTEAPATEPAPETTEPVTPPTGDSAIIFAIISVIAIAGVAVVSKRREN